MIPSTDRGRGALLGLVLLMAGLSIGLPPLAIWGPGAALTVAGLLLLLLTFTTPPEAAP